MKKRSKQEWHDLFVQQAASGLSANQFCEANDLCAKHFSLRKKQLTRPKPLSSPTFVPVAMTPPHVPAHAITGPALVLRHGISALYFDTTPNPDWLAQVLRALA